MAQSLLHDGQHLLASGHEHHTVGIQAGSGETWCKQVRLLDDPKHRTLQAGEDSRDQQSGRRTMLHVRSSPDCFVQGGQRQTTVGQDIIDNRYAEWQNSAGDAVALLEMCDPGPQLVQRHRSRGAC